MSLPQSVYAETLSLRGFDRWEDEGSPRAILETLPFDTIPVFFRITFFELEMTFVLDEYYIFWAAEGVIDLSDLDIAELEFSHEGSTRLMN